MAQIHKTAVVEGNVELAEGVVVGPCAVICGDITVGEKTEISSGAVIEGNVKIGKNNKIGIGASIGTAPQSFIYEEGGRVSIGDDNLIREYVTINRATVAGKATIIGDKTMLMAYAHVAHDCTLADEVVIANSVALGGHIEVQEKVVIGGMTPVHQFVRIGKMAIVGGGSRISKDVVPYCLIAGNPPRDHGLNSVGLRRRNYPSSIKMKLKKAYRIIFRSGLNTSQALDKIKEREDLNIPEVQEMVNFIKSSKRGIAR